MAYQKKFNGYYTVIENDGGETLGVMDAPVIEKDGFAFKDLAGTGELLPYEDWRLSPEERAKDLAARLSPEAVAGLTLFSSHQSVPAGGRFGGTYGGKPFDEAGVPAYELSDAQKKFIPEDGIRTVLLTDACDIETLARWNNNLQALAESSPFGIPVSLSSDPATAPVTPPAGSPKKWSPLPSGPRGWGWPPPSGRKS